MENQKTLIAACSDTKKIQNQDFVAFIQGDKNVILVADGVGSSAYAAEGARFVIEEATRILLELDFENINYTSLFQKIQLALDDRIALEQQNLLGLKYRPFSTTLILAIEKKEVFEIAYIGNGAILHIRGNFMNFPIKTWIIPWTCVNYLNPHTIPVDGSEVLYKCFGAKADRAKVEPTVLTISKDNFEFGDILVICTDGIYSIDHQEIFEDSLGYALPQPYALKNLNETLQNFLKGKNLSNEELNKTITNYLVSLKQIPYEMNDDCSLGLFITPKALEYSASITSQIQHNTLPKLSSSYSEETPSELDVTNLTNEEAENPHNNFVTDEKSIENVLYLKNREEEE
jgi:serine/threonine protein phosphatase PrpC